MGKKILIRDVPDAVHEAIERKAADEGLSVQDFLLAYFTDLAQRPSVRELLRRAADRTGE